MAGMALVVFLVVLALLYVVQPFRRRSHAEMVEGPSPAQRAEEKKTSALTAIIDLEEEAQVGKLTPHELERLRESYEREALEALAQLDALAATPVAEDPLEAEIAAVKQRLTCPSCGAPRASGGTCSRCDA